MKYYFVVANLRGLTLESTKINVVLKVFNLIFNENGYPRTHKISLSKKIYAPQFFYVILATVNNE